jgi:Heparinase II/III-like protein/Heparinase II/III N-terminus
MRPGRLLDKVRAMDGEELRHRAAAAIRREAARLRHAVRPPVWDRRALAGALRADVAALQPIRLALGCADWAAAHASLMSHIAGREARFPLDPRSRHDLAGIVCEQCPGARADAIARADRIVAGRFDLLGYQSLEFRPAEPGRGIDWHADPVHGRRAPRLFWSQVPYLDPSAGDHKIIWELNRHQYFLSLGRAYWLTGDETYRDAFVDHLHGWMLANPPLTGINWASMLEIGFRSLSWIWALHFFSMGQGAAAGEKPWTIDLLLGLDRQLSQVEANLSRYFSPNTHLLGEALALYVAGRTLPELRRAAGWEAIGREVLVEQARAQVNADGGHVELSAHYHRYTLDFYLFALLVAERTNDPAADALAGTAEKLAQYARTLADERGRLPAIGDDDGGMLVPMCGRDPADASDTLQLAAAVLARPELAVGGAAEEVIWMTGRAPALPATVQQWPSAALPESGYFVSRTTRGDHLIVDAGPHGFLNGGHAHADALSVTLSVRGTPLLIDPGTACYTINAAMRDRFRSTSAHNTVTVDGRPQSIPAGPFHWRTAARSSPREWVAAGIADVFRGAHDGYAPLTHERTVIARPGCWIVADRVDDPGGAAHRADVYWHLDPAWRATRTGPAGIRADHPSSRPVWILALPPVDGTVIQGEPGSELGWCAPVYGRLVPTATLRFTRRGTTPFDVVTVVVEPEDWNDVPRIELLDVLDAGGENSAGGAIGFAVRTRQWSDTILIASTSRRRRVGDLETAARLLCWRASSAGAGPALLVGGDFARSVAPSAAPLRAFG